MLRSIVLGIIALWFIWASPLFAQNSALLENALSGDPLAQHRMGALFFDGDSVDQDFDEAIRWYQMAAAQGHAPAQYQLGWIFFYGKGVDPVEDGYLRRWRVPAHLDAGIIERLRDMYESGKGVDQNPSYAIQWWTLAAEQGHAPSQYELGWVYFNGISVEEDYDVGLRWLHLSAHQGNSDAQYALGHAYDVGMGVDFDKSEALRFWRLAAEQGNVDAQLHLGRIYQGADISEAMHWYHLAAEQGEIEAYVRLGRIYSGETGSGLEIDVGKAAHWYRLAAAQGSVYAAGELANMYDEGEGVEKDPREAIRLWRLAAAAGVEEAQYNIGMAYFEGRGVERDCRQALEWFRLAGERQYYGHIGGGGYIYRLINLAMKHETCEDYTGAVRLYQLAAERGFSDAQIRLGFAHFQGNGVDVDDVLALMWFQVAASRERAWRQSVPTNLLRMIDSIETLMTPSQIAEAQALAQACLSREFRDCGY